MKYINTPFALSGDKKEIPDTEAGTVTGEVNFDKGYGPDYEKDLATSADAKVIERDYLNYLFYLLTSELQRYQRNGVPDYVSAADNGGSAVAYPLAAMVRYDAGSGVDIYYSIKNNNTSTPSDTAAWKRLPYKNLTEFGSGLISSNDAPAARSLLGLGDASTKNIGQLSGNVMSVGAFGLGAIPPETNSIAGQTGFTQGLGLNGIDNHNTYIYIPHTDTRYSTTLAICFSGSTFGRVLAKVTDTTRTVYVTMRTDLNTTVDSNGFIKQASPVVKLFGNGSNEVNDEAKGVLTSRISEGVYIVSGAAMGFNSDTAWHIEIPCDENKQPLIWVDYVVEGSGDIVIKSYHRTHPASPNFAQNIKTGVNDGDPIDIPKGRWVDLRVQTYPVSD
ncbi:hypothetical protein LPW36_01910 [Jinshanibacter sp. LJY008]|uniref:Phage tail protein C-terminal domain-containing protein n=1 Tax=Limnobaculum eriocheiris TaxID=2897391 RepID=A0A9X1MTM2_9GAMM|nr:hypothetical protein [Limnobaculum eriocheiris]MCD1124799.1 hypothetical protein [Limnobaculum eriocheiris]